MNPTNGRSSHMDLSYILNSDSSNFSSRPSPPNGRASQMELSFILNTDSSNHHGSQNQPSDQGHRPTLTPDTNLNHYVPTHTTQRPASHEREAIIHNSVHGDGCRHPSVPGTSSTSTGRRTWQGSNAVFQLDKYTGQLTRREELDSFARSKSEKSDPRRKRSFRFACYCNKLFTSSKSLQEHVDATHASHPKHFCEVCRKSFTQRTSLQYHRRKCATHKRNLERSRPSHS